MSLVHWAVTGIKLANPGKTLTHHLMLRECLVASLWSQGSALSLFLAALPPGPQIPHIVPSAWGAPARFFAGKFLLIKLHCPLQEMVLSSASPWPSLHLDPHAASI